MSQSSQVCSTSSPSPSSYSNQALDSSVFIGEAYKPHQNLSSSGSGEISSSVATASHGVNYLDFTEKAEEMSSSSSLEMNQALRRLEEQLSLNDETFQEICPLYGENGNSYDSANIVYNQSSFAGMQLNPDGLASQYHAVDTIQNHQVLREEGNVWQEIQDDFQSSKNAESLSKHSNGLDQNGMLLAASRGENLEEYKEYNLLNFGGKDSQLFTSIPQEVDGFKYLLYPTTISTYGTNHEDYSTIFDQHQSGSPLEDGLSLTIAQKQKFTILDISPEWGYASETTKVIVIGSFLCEPADNAWTCMFGDVEVPVQVIREGVIRCQAPPHLPGKVNFCVTSGNREACSEVREFIYHVKPTACAHSSLLETDSRSREELLLLVRFAEMLLSNSQMVNGDTAETGTDPLTKYRSGKDSWRQVLDALLDDGTWTSASTTEWLLQELLKDKLTEWLCSRSQEDSESFCSLSKKEQGIIHMIAGLGFEWALHPILRSGVSVNYRDIKGWTALHWAVRFGREKMVAALVACGASAGAVTDPKSQDPVGKTPASIAATYGHKGLAGYLSEVALTSHLSSLTLKESELSKGSADVEAERTITSVSTTCPSTNEDHLSLKDTLAAVRNAAQAAARIQSAFRAHSFRKRHQREASETAAFAIGSADEFGVISKDIHGLSAASKLAFRNIRDSNSAALSIQKKFRGWKGRKDFLAFRQKVVKIQAHVRGYQTRKEYKVCWAVGVLEKVILRWRRRGVGLRGFRQESESIDETEDVDILKVFRKQKVDAAIDEAVSRVLLMVKCPEARQQYRRILEKYRQAKAVLEGVEKEQAEVDKFWYMENDVNYQFK